MFINVKSYGAKVDGETDDTDAVQRAINFAHEEGGGIVLFPAGDCMVSGLELKSDVVLQGVGKNASTIKLIDGSDQHVVYSTNFDILVGTSPSTGDYGVAAAGLRSIKIDGNEANQTIEKHGFAYFGIDCILEDVAVTGAKGWGIYREAPGTWYHDGGWQAYGRNAQDDIRFIEVYENRVGNFFYNGQSDSTLFSVLCYRVLNSKDNIPGGVNFFNGPKSTGIRMFGMHCWGFSDYGIVNEAPTATFTNCHVESADIAKVWIKAQTSFNGRVYEVVEENYDVPAFLIATGVPSNSIVASISQCATAVQFEASDPGYGFYEIQQYSNDEDAKLFSTTPNNTNFVSARLYGNASSNIFITPSIKNADGSPFQFVSRGQNFSFFTDPTRTHPSFGIENISGSNAYIATAGSNNGPGPAFLVRGGTSADLDMRLIPKGAGKVRFGTYVASSGSVSGYIEVKDSNGVIRKLAVID